MIGNPGITVKGKEWKRRGKEGTTQFSQSTEVFRPAFFDWNRA
jgi:hypothetical protein